VGQDAILRVRDDGPGIPPSEHQHIFRRLTRLDASRSRPGHGLGLSLVDAIMRAHGGSVSIVPTTIGLRICCNLPAVDNPLQHFVAKAS
jgi:signal transduction histidine kinase